VTEIIQGSPEWFEIRLGKVTASRIADVTARTKTGWGASRGNYMAELLVERLTGRAAESYTNAAMQWGTDQEPFARTAYELMKDCDVVQIGFAAHPTIAMAGASPDGLIGETGLTEFKCPNTSTHVDTLLGDSIDGKYVKQCQWQLACTGRQWCDFVSFDPRLPASMQLFVRRVTRDDAMIAALEKDVREFLAELDGKIADLRARYEAKAAAA
jgi:putative phage-type endonuclease